MSTAIRISFQDAASAIGLVTLMHMARDDLGGVQRLLPPEHPVYEDAHELAETIKYVITGTLPGRLIAITRQTPQAMEHLGLHDVLMLMNQTVSLKSLAAYMSVLVQLNPDYLAKNRITSLVQAGMASMAHSLPFVHCAYQDTWQMVTQMHFDGFWMRNKQRHDLLMPLQITVRFSGLSEDDTLAISHLTTKILSRSGDPVPQVEWSEARDELTVRSTARPSNIQTLQNALRSGFGEHIESPLIIHGGALFTAAQTVSRPALTGQTLQRS